MSPVRGAPGLVGVNTELSLILTQPIVPSAGSCLSPLAEEASLSALRLVAADPSRIASDLDLHRSLANIAKLLEALHEPGRLSTVCEITVSPDPKNPQVECLVGFGVYGPTGTTYTEAVATREMALATLSGFPSCWLFEACDPAALQHCPNEESWSICQTDFPIADERAEVRVPSRFHRSPNSWLRLINVLLSSGQPTRFRTSLLASELSFSEQLEISETTALLYGLFERVQVSDPVAAPRVQRALFTMADLRQSLQCASFVGEVVLTSVAPIPEATLRAVASSISDLADVTYNGSLPTVAALGQLLGGYSLVRLDQSCLEVAGHAWAQFLPTPGGVRVRSLRDLLSITEASYVYQVPVPAGAPIPGIRSAVGRARSAACASSPEGAVIGTDTMGRPVGIPITPGGHVHVTGATGTGKSTVLDALNRFLIDNHHRCPNLLLVDPHGDLARRASLAAAEAGVACVVIRPGSKTSPSISLSPRTGALRERSSHIDRVASIVVDAVTRFMPADWSGPRFRRSARAVVAAVLSTGGRLADVAAVLANDQQLATLANDDRLDPNTAGALRALVSPANPDRVGIQDWVAAKFDELAHSGLADVFDRDGIDLGETLRDHVVIVDLSDGLTRAETTVFASLFFDLAIAALFQREPNARTPVCVVVDEMQLLPAATLRRVLDEGRKFGVGLIAAHQHSGQLDAVLAESIAGAAATTICLRQHHGNAIALASTMGIAPSDLSELPDLQAIVRTRTTGPEALPFHVTLYPYPGLPCSERTSHHQATIPMPQSDFDIRGLAPLRCEHAVRDQSGLAHLVRSNPPNANSPTSRVTEREQRRADLGLRP